MSAARALFERRCHSSNVAKLKEPSLWSVEVDVPIVDDGFVNAWLNFGARVQHPRLEQTETWGVDEQPGGMRARAEFLIRAADASAARAVGIEVLEQVIGAESEWHSRHRGMRSEVTARPAPLAKQHAEDATPQSAADYETRLLAACWHRSEAVGDGRRVRIMSVGGGAPLERVDIQERRSRVTITLFERHPPRFLPDGSPTAASAAAVVKCVEIALKQPLGARALIDGATGQPPPTIESGEDDERLALALAVDLSAFPCRAIPTAHR
jgi:hypothetical protein